MLANLEKAALMAVASVQDKLAVLTDEPSAPLNGGYQATGDAVGKWVGTNFD